jgi:hypothetical protein
LTTAPQLLPSDPKEFASTLWFKRHWKWFVPVGLVVSAAGVLAFGLGLVQVMKQSDAYQIAFNRARTEPTLIKQLGEPIRDGWFLQGNIELTNRDGTANLAFPIRGPLGEATVYVVAKKTAGRWHFPQLEVVTDSGRREIDLSDPADRPERYPRP